MEVNLTPESLNTQPANNSVKSDRSQKSSGFDQQLSKAKSDANPQNSASKDGNTAPPKRQAIATGDKQAKSSNESRHSDSSQQTEMDDTETNPDAIVSEQNTIPVQTTEELEQQSETELSAAEQVAYAPSERPVIESEKSSHAAVMAATTTKIQRPAWVNAKLSVNMEKAHANGKADEPVDAFNEELVADENIDSEAEVQHYNRAKSKTTMPADDNELVQQMTRVAPEKVVAPLHAKEQVEKTVVNANDLKAIKGDMIKAEVARTSEPVVNTDVKVNQTTDTGQQGSNFNQHAEFSHTKQEPSQAKVNDVKMDFIKLENMPVTSKKAGDLFLQKMEIIAKNNAQNARISLDPPELGYMEVRVSHGADRVNIAFSASTQAAKDLIEANLERLEELLNEQGLGAGQVDVGLSHGEDSHQQFGYKPGKGQTGPHSGLSTMDEEVITMPSQNRKENGLDLFA